jgi:predicted dehydrogenase
MLLKESFRVAVIGAGYMAREHIRAFLDIEQIKVVGIHSRTRVRATDLASEFDLPEVCNSIAELYYRTRAQLVIVAVPELSTNQVCSECFEFPWAVLIEKPAGYNFADAQEIETAASVKNRLAFVAFNRRHYASTLSVIDDLAQQQGHRFIHVQDQEDQVRALQAGQPPIVVENWMYANSIHLIDYFLIMGRGNICSVESIIPWNPNQTAPQYVVAKISYDSGDIGLYEGIWNGPGPWAVTVNTVGKRWEMRPLEQASFQVAGQRTLELVVPHMWDTQFKPGLRRQAKLAVEATLGNSNKLPTLRDSLKTIRLTRDIFGL